MTLSKVELYVFRGNRAHFLTAFNSEHDSVRLTLTAVEKESDRAADTVATFTDATMVNVWKDPEDADEWPLDIIGFDCYPEGNRWKFVLNCGSTEWIWESNWPVLNAEASDCCR